MNKFNYSNSVLIVYVMFLFAHRIFAADKVPHVVQSLSCMDTYSLALRSCMTARRLLEDGHKQGHVASSLELSEFYLYGIGGPKDVEGSLNILTEQAKKGHAIASIKAGDRYFFGHGITRDMAEAFNYYCLAAGQNSYLLEQETQGLNGLNDKEERRNLLRAALMQHGVLKPDLPPLCVGAPIVAQPYLKLPLLSDIKLKEPIDAAPVEQPIIDIPAEIIDETLGPKALAKAKKYLKSRKRQDKNNAISQLAIYFSECDKRGLIKESDVLYEYGLLVRQGKKIVGDDRDAQYYWQKAHEQGHEKASLEIAQIYIQQAKFDQAKTILMNLKGESIAVYSALLNLYWDNKFTPLDEEMPMIFRGLLALAEGSGDDKYRAANELLLRLTQKEPLALSNIATIEIAIAKLREEEEFASKIEPIPLAQSYTLFALHHIAKSNFTNLERYLVDFDPSDYALTSEEQHALIYGYVKTKCIPRSISKIRSLMNSYLNKRLEGENFFLSNSELNAYFWTIIRLAHVTDTPEEIFYLKEAHKLKDRKATLLYVQKLHKNQQIMLIHEIIDEILPADKIMCAPMLLEHFDKTMDKADPDEGAIAMFYASFIEGSHDKLGWWQLYISFAALSGQPEATFKVGKAFFNGEHGFKQDKKLAKFWLQKVPKKSPFHHKARIKMADLDLEDKDYEKYAKGYIAACADKHFSEDSLFAVYMAAHHLGSFQQRALRAQVLKAGRALEERFFDNQAIKWMKHASAHDLIDQLYSGEKIKESEVLSFIKNDESNEAMVVKASLQLYQKKYEDAYLVLRHILASPAIYQNTLFDYHALNAQASFLTARYSDAFASVKDANPRDNILQSYNLALLHFLGLTNKMTDAEAWSNLTIAANNPEILFAAVINNRKTFKPLLLANLPEEHRLSYVTIADRIRLMYEKAARLNVPKQDQPAKNTTVMLSSCLKPLIAALLGDLQLVSATIMDFMSADPLILPLKSGVNNNHPDIINHAEKATQIWSEVYDAINILSGLK